MTDTTDPKDAAWPFAINSADTSEAAPIEVTDELREAFKTEFVQRMVTSGGLLLEAAEEQLPGNEEIDEYIREGTSGEEQADEEMSCWEPDGGDSDDSDIDQE